MAGKSATVKEWNMEENDRQPVTAEEQAATCAPATDAPLAEEVAPAGPCNTPLEEEAAPAEAVASSEADEAEEPAPVAQESADGTEETEPDLEYPEVAAALNRYYDELSRLIRIAKAKDDAIARLTREVQTYREGFAMKLTKPLVSELIQLREDYRKTLRGVENYCKTAADAVKYCGYLASDIEDLLMNFGVETAEGGYFADGVSIWEKQPKKGKPPVLEPEEPHETQDAPIKGTTFRSLLLRVEQGNEKLKALLQDNAAADANLARLSIAAEALDDNYADAILLPLYRSLALLHRELCAYKDGLEGELTEENKTEKYQTALMTALDGVDKLLLQAGVTVVTDPSDNYDLATNRLLKTVPTDDPALDKKIAFRHTDCYMYDGKMIYPCKVDVYKYTPKN